MHHFDANNDLAKINLRHRMVICRSVLQVTGAGAAGAALFALLLAGMNSVSPFTLPVLGAFLISFLIVAGTLAPWIKTDLRAFSRFQALLNAYSRQAAVNMEAFNTIREAYKLKSSSLSLGYRAMDDLLEYSVQMAAAVNSLNALIVSANSSSLSRRAQESLTIQLYSLEDAWESVNSLAFTASKNIGISPSATSVATR